MSYALPSIQVAKTTHFKVFSISSPDLTKGERACVLSAYMSSMSKFSTQEATVSFVMNFLSVAQPALANELTRASSVDIVNTPMTKRAYMQALDVEDKSKDFTLPEGFPPLPKRPSNSAVANTSSLNAYAGAAMVLFSIGKEFTPDNEKGAKENRPKALRGQFSIPEEEFKSSPGREDGPSIESLGQVYSAFNVYTEIRSIVIRVFLSIYRAGGHQTHEMGLMMVSIRLLDGAQMTHVSTVQDMLEAHPWLLKVPALRPSIKEYVEELKRYSQLPAPVRGYIRLIENNQNLYFPASKMKPLVAVAVSLKTDIEESMKLYAGGKDQYTSLVAEVRRYKDGFLMQRGVDTLSKALDMPDVELPALSESVVLTPQSQ